MGLMKPAFLNFDKVLESPNFWSKLMALPKNYSNYSVYESKNQNRNLSKRKSVVSNMVTLRVTIGYGWLRQVIASERK